VVLVLVVVLGIDFADTDVPLRLLSLSVACEDDNKDDELDSFDEGFES
jgi:hypothetical protein